MRTVSSLTRKAALVAAIAGYLFSAMTARAEDPAAWLKEHRITPPGAPAKAEDGTSIRWFPAEMFTIEGKGFDDTPTTWSRLPERFKGKVTNGVWGNSRMSAGIAVRFVTDSPAIYAEWTAPREAMKHMTYAGSNGLDMYKFSDGRWEFAASGIPTSSTSTVRIFPRKYAQLDTSFDELSEPAEYLLFLPLYSPTDSIRIGVTSASAISRGPDRYKDKKAIVFYGTSISQGACAPRSGLGHVERLRRILDHPTVNLGFSGTGRCEPEMADVLAGIPAALYVIETVPNMTDEMVDERAAAFVKKLRGLKPDTPILMVESPNVPLNTNRNKRWKAAHDKAVAEGVDNLHYLQGDDLYGGTDNPTVDGVHPTDLGYYMMAEHYAPKLREILKLSPAPETTRH